ncbi:MAG: succinate dehydrogenase iron-sulfur subunit [Candidatus Micrarchaeales archaeon]|nr:succinate dehydrogenase iron-sulfur subunit [Candidatus Micrarchaeales archaeon]
MADKYIRKVRIKVEGFDAEKWAFSKKDYDYTATNNTTVLDALISIKEHQDHAVSFRYSCRMGICGSCAMVINGKPRLACETKIFDLGDEIAVGPMRGEPILRSLVTDFDDFFEKHSEVLPWLVKKDSNRRFNDKTESRQTAAQRDSYLPFAECIKCGLCVDACPVANTNKKFLGPQALAQAYRYDLDSRDEGREQRLERLDSLEGAWGCEFSGSCSVVCPKSVDPALAIQLLKSDIAEYRLLKKGKSKNRK